MKCLPTIDQEFFNNQKTMKIYAIAVCPNWEHWHATDCPRPIQELLAEYPDVRIERVSGWRGKVDILDISDEAIDPQALPQPVFRVDLSESQAVAFSQDLQALSRRVGQEEDFYFLTIDRNDFPACLSAEELEHGVDLNEIDLSCLLPGNENSELPKTDAPA